MKARIVQLLARYVGMALAAFGVTAGDEQTTQLASLIVAGVLLVADLVLHSKQKAKR
jgi:sulfite exporter TauE/SafE